MMEKELPCPHCGQNLRLEANVTEQLRQADKLAKAVKIHIDTTEDSVYAGVFKALAAYEKSRSQ